MVISARAWWSGWLLVVEDQLSRLVLTRFQEAHHLPVIRCIMALWLLPTNGRNEPMGDHLRLKVSGGTALGDGQVGSIPNGIDVFMALDLQRVAIRREPALLISKTRLLNHFCPAMRRDQHQQVIGDLFALK